MGDLRFIPTPVGNTNQRNGGGHKVAVHPHTRGEHEVFAVPVVGKYGSSPHPWGTPGGEKLRQLLTRFIPTPVGNTRAIALVAGVNPVHPHTRGEHSVNDTDNGSVPGSSPHPWGTLM